MIIGGMKKVGSGSALEEECIFIYTQGCVFRCEYCFRQNFLEFNEGNIGENEVLEYIDSHKRTASWVCISGGEPTLQNNLEEFIKKIKDKGMKVKIETTGVNPTLLEKLIKDKLLDFISMDIKNRWEYYLKIIGIDDMNIVEKCKMSFGLIQPSDVEHEFRTTVIPDIHKDEDIFTIAGYLKKNEKYCIQNVRSSSDFLFLKNNESPHYLHYLHGLVEKLQSAFPDLKVYER